MKLPFRLFAIPGAVAAAGMVVLLAAWAAGAGLARIERLSPQALFVLRTLCLAMPAVVVPLAAASRRRRRRQDEAASGEPDRRGLQ